MKRFTVLFSILAVFVWSGAVWANSAPSVSNITASQRTDGSGIVDIYYTLSDSDNDRCTVSIEVSDDGGGSWDVPATALSGDIGDNISPGGRHITWNSKTDLPGAYGTNYRVKVIADDGVVDGPDGMVWVYINDPGVSGHEGFAGYMSKYESTNAQYCQYLNSAMNDGLITVHNDVVYAVSDTGHNEAYSDTYAADDNSQIVYSHGTFSVRSRDGYSMANHPVVEVSWYGATAFCNYYGYRLPTEWEWQAVADYDGTYTYGSGTTIDHSKANYYWDNPLNLSSYPYTSPVGYYGAFGYGLCDTAANAWEWTSSCYYAGCDYGSRVLRGGGWNVDASLCRVAYRRNDLPQTSSAYGFRVVLGALSSTGSGLSNIFTIDNRDTEEGPFVTAVSSQYCSQSEDAYFLEGVSLEQEFTATVDWGDKTPSQIKWYRDDAVIATDTVSGSSVSRIFDVGTEFDAGEKLYVQAVADDATESARVRANFEIVSPPPGLASWMLSFQHGKYKSIPFNIGFPELKKDPPAGSDDNKLSDIAQIHWKSIIEVEAETDLSGHTEIKVASEYLSEDRLHLKKDDFRIANVSVQGVIRVALTFDYADGQWRPGGGFDLGVSGEYKAPPTYVIFIVGFIPIPTYYRFAVDASVSANCRFTDGTAEEPIFSGDIPVRAGLEGMAGVGAADVLALEGYLRGGLNFEFQVPEEPYLKDWHLSLGGGIRICLIVYMYENNLLYYRWPEEKGAMLFSVQALKVEDLEPMSRDYLKGDYARWHGSTKTMKTMDMQPLGAGGTETTLQTNIFGQSNAVLAVSGSTKCLVWLYDEPSRNGLDRTMLVYSINNGGGWSDPCAIDDDGTADATLALAVDASGNFVCAWANTSQLIADGTDLSDFADKLDIRMATYDSGTDTWNSETVTSEAALDYNPKIGCDGGGNITIVWTHDNNNDMLAENPPVTNTLLARTKTGPGWEVTQTLATVSGLVKYSDAEADAINSYIVYCVDTDSNFATDTDNELFYIDNASGSWAIPLQLTNDPNADVNPQFVKTSTDLMLVWARDGKIVSTTDITGMTGITDVVPEEGSSGQRSFTSAVSPTDNISVVWNDPSEEGSDIYTATYDPTIMAWSGVVQITDNRAMERSITAIYSAGDTLDLAYNKVHIEDANGLDAFGQVDLCVYEYSIGSDLTVTADSMSIDDPNAVPSDTVTLQATIANNGDIAIGNIPVAFYCGETADPCSQIDETQVIIADLAAGDEVVASVSWTIPESNEPLNVIVVIDPNLQIEDKDRQNNSASVKMFGANVSIENVVIGQDADRNFYITADILNTGFVPVSEDVDCVIVDSNDPNTVFDTQQIAIPDPNQSHTITLTIACEDLDYGFNEVKLIVDPNDRLDESSKMDNVRTITLKNTAPGDFVIDGIIDALDLDVLTSQWLQEPGIPSADIAPWPTDGFVNFLDFALLTERWLETVE